MMRNLINERYTNGWDISISTKNYKQRFTFGVKNSYRLLRKRQTAVWGKEQIPGASWENTNGQETCEKNVQLCY